MAPAHMPDGTHLTLNVRGSFYSAVELAIFHHHLLRCLSAVLLSSVVRPLLSPSIDVICPYYLYPNPPVTSGSNT